MARKAKPVKGLSDDEVMDNAKKQGGWHTASTLPTTPIDYKAIALAAAQYGVVIHPDETWFPLKKKPSCQTIHSHIGGSLVVVVEIPAKKEARTVFVTNGRSKALNMPRNHIAQYITLKPLFGTVIWLPRKYVK